MYCSKCGAEFGPNESSCFNCGAPRPVRDKTYEKNSFMNGNGLKDNYIPMLWELLILCLLIEVISYLILPASSSIAALNNFFSLPSSMMGSMFSGAGFSALFGSVNSMLAQMPSEWNLSIFIGILAALLNVALFILAAWRAFKKADMEGWKALIPIYNIYCVFKIVLGNGWNFLLIPAYIIFYLLILSITASSADFASMTGFAVVMIIIAYIYLIWFAYRASKRFHHGWGYTIGLMMFTNLFIMFLGWGPGMVDEEEENNDNLDHSFNRNAFEDYHPAGASTMEQKQIASVKEEPVPELPKILKCPACGEPVEADWEFCRHCGAKLSSEQWQQNSEIPEKGKCPVCGEPVEADWKFCRHCGAQLSGEQ